MHTAFESGYSEIVELLIDNGSDMNIKNNNGKVPSQLGVTFDHKRAQSRLSSEKHSLCNSVQLEDKDVRLKTFSLEKALRFMTSAKKGPRRLNTLLNSGENPVSEMLSQRDIESYDLSFEKIENAKDDAINCENEDESYLDQNLEKINPESNFYQFNTYFSSIS